jgi:hypothetical protein
MKDWLTGKDVLKALQDGFGIACRLVQQGAAGVM